MIITTPAPGFIQATGISELTAASSASFRQKLKEAADENTHTIEIDLSQTSFLDSSGLGALISIHKQMQTAGGVFRLLNPSAKCRQIIELTRLHRTFEIVTREG